MEKALTSLALRWQGTRLEYLDQTELPHRTIWKSAENFSDMVEAISKLRVRGAPLIGVAAAASYAQQVLKNFSEKSLIEGAEALIGSRPTAVNLRAAVERCRRSTNPVAEAVRIFEEDIALCDRIGNHGGKIFANYRSVMTYCNAGGLATAGIGTAIGVLQKAHEINPKLHVFVPETRPLFQGARLTEWELNQYGISHTLICDNMIGSLMAKGKIDAVVLGADRIARNGDVANKIGTYNVAVLANYHKVPFYVAAPYTTLDAHCPTGQEIIIEEREPSEIHLDRARTDAPAFNPAFDVTPAGLVTGYILDSGVHPVLTDSCFEVI